MAGTSNINGNNFIGQLTDLNSNEAQNFLQNTQDIGAPNAISEARITNDTNIGQGGPYSKVGKASGGWSQFPTDEQGDNMHAVGADSLIGMDFPDAEGGNSYTIVALKNSADSTASLNGFADPRKFVDRPGESPWYGSDNGPNTREPLTSEIIKWAQENESGEEGGGKNKRPYKYTDFVFCKHWNKIPNNYMMTLRRFPYPCFDNLQFPGENGSDNVSGVTPQKYYSPIAQAITYMGEESENQLSTILTFDSGLPYEEIKADVHAITGNNPGSEALGGGAARVLGILSGDANREDILRQGTAVDPYNNGPYMNRVLGPLNRIDSSMKRSPGLKFEQKFELKFHYVARPIGNANTKAVMLDILANLLTLTYAEASFWGGLHRFAGGRPAYPFLGGDAGFNALFQGNMNGFYDALKSQINRATGNISDIFNSILSGDPIEGLKNLASQGAGIGMGALLAGANPAAWQLPALLTGNPVGEWHLTVGNPLNPMLEIGNLVCTNLKIEFGNELGPDDFPLEMTATISLEHGMPRDKAAVESMFNRGGGKIYHIPDEYQFGVSKNSLTGSAVDEASTRDFEQSNQTVHKRTSRTKSSSDIDRLLTNAQRDASKVSKNLLETAKMVTGYTSTDQT